jgi:predicted O-methyltransferase YrrM
MIRRRRAEPRVRTDFYSPIPDLEALPADVYDRRSELAGIAFDSAAQIAWAERELAPRIAAFQAPEGFRLDNSYYESVDAEVCDAMIRHLQPARVVELGSGWSTLLLRAAAPGRVTTYDPYPGAHLAVGGTIEPLAAQDVPLRVFEELQAGDVLFVDTSHTVKIGGDVNRIVLDVLPRLASGVVVHFHDIWLPYEYHRTLVETMGMYWAEQYLLQAFLIGNDGWEVLFAAQAIAHEHPDRLRALVPSYTGESYPSAFWMRRR